MQGPRRKLRVAAGAILLACVGLGASAIETHHGSTVSVTGERDQLVFAAGDDVTLSLNATDDVAAAGDQVRAQGATFDHLFVGSGHLSFADSTARDLFLAGGQIDLLSGVVSDDVVAAGGRITVARAARVDGDVVIAGRDLRVEAPIGGGVRAAGANVYLDGPIAGDVHVDGRSITIGPGARIQGALTHRGRTVSISPEAQITGPVTALQPRPQPNMQPLAGFAIWFSAALLFGLFLMAIVIATLLPRLMNDTAELIRSRPLSMLALGFGIAILTPFVIVLLMVTLLGLPLAFVLGLTFALLWPVALVGAVYTGSMIARGRMRDAGPPSAGTRALWVGLAMIVFIVVGLIPVLGFLAWLAAYLVGLGAVTLQAGRALSKPAAVAA
jgi:hypothetical protein